MRMMYGPVPGRKHDSSMLVESKLIEHLDASGKFVKAGLSFPPVTIRSIRVGETFITHFMVTPPIT